MPLQPFTGTFGTTELRHLLRRTLFGYTKADLDYFQGQSLIQVVDHLLKSLPLPSPPVRFVDAYRNDTAINDGINNRIEVPQSIPNDPNNLPIPGGGTYDLMIVLPNSPAGYARTYASNNTYIGPNGGVGNMNTQWVNRVPQHNFDDYQKASVISWWCGQMLNHTPIQANVRTKMSLFLHNLLPVQDRLNALYSYQYLDLLQRYSLGSYKELVKKMTLEPLMLDYLNGNGSSSIGVDPNENYARELLELFTIGKKSLDKDKPISDVSSYREEDIDKIATILSGWYIQPISPGGFNTETGYRNRISPNNPNGLKRVMFDATKHNNIQVDFSGYFNASIQAATSLDETAARNKITQLIDIIFAKDDVALHIVRKLYRFFVYGFTDKDTCPILQNNQTIEASIIVPLSQTLKNNNYNLRPVLKELLMSKHFFTQTGTLIKSPFDLVVGTLRLFDLDKHIPPIYVTPSNGAPAIYQVSSRGGEKGGVKINLKCLARYRMWEVVVASNAMDMGFQLFNPPNVAGLPAYHQQGMYHREWIASSVFLNKRMLFLKRLISSNTPYSIPNVAVNQSLLSNISNCLYPNFSEFKLSLHNQSGFLPLQHSPLLEITKKIVGITNPSIDYDSFLNALFDYFLSVRPIPSSDIWISADYNLQKLNWFPSVSIPTSPWKEYLTAQPYAVSQLDLIRTNYQYMHDLLTSFFENCIFKSPDFQLM